MKTKKQTKAIDFKLITVCLLLSLTIVTLSFIFFFHSQSPLEVIQSSQGYNNLKSIFSNADEVIEPIEETPITDKDKPLKVDSTPTTIDGETLYYGDVFIELGDKVISTPRYTSCVYQTGNFLEKNKTCEIEIQTYDKVKNKSNSIIAIAEVAGNSSGQYNITDTELIQAGFDIKEIKVSSSYEIKEKEVKSENDSVLIDKKEFNSYAIEKDKTKLIKDLGLEGMFIDPDISACGTIMNEGIYTQTANLHTTSAGPCILFNSGSQNITYNGNGYNITFAVTNGFQYAFAFSTGNDNITIRNSIINNNLSGSNMQVFNIESAVSNILIENNTIDLITSSSIPEALLLNNVITNVTFKNNFARTNGTTFTGAVRMGNAGVSNVLILNNTFYVNGTNDISCFRWNSGQNSSFVNNTCYLNGATTNNAFIRLQNAQDNQNVSFSGNSFTDLGTTTRDLYSSTGRGNGTILSNQPIRNYSLSLGRQITFENTTSGKINFLYPISGSGNNLVGNSTSVIVLDENALQVNLTFGSTTFNQSANVSFYNEPATGLQEPLNLVWNNEIPCNESTSPSCSNFTSLSAETVEVNVSSWLGTLSINGTAGSSIIPVNVSSCGTLALNDTYYQLNQSISASGTCLTVIAYNSTIDGNGWNITYNTGSAGHGITMSNKENNTIKNVRIIQSGTTGSSYGIYQSGSGTTNANLTIFNASIYTCQDAIRVQERNATISYSNLTTYCNTGNGLYSIGLQTTLDNNDITVSGQNPAGLYLVGSNTRVTNNRITTNYIDSTAIFLEGITNTHYIYNNTILTKQTGANGIYVYNRISKVNIINNSITTLQTGSKGIYFDRSSHIFTSGNIINTSQDSAIYITSDAFDPTQNMTLSGNNLIYTGAEQLTVSTSTSSAYIHLLNQNVTNYSFSSTAQNVVINNTQYGELRFLSAISGSGTNLYGNATASILIGNNTANISSSENANLNKPTNVILYGIGDRGFSNPKVLGNGYTCTNCYNFTSLEADKVRFNVSSWLPFSGYSIGEANAIPVVEVINVIPAGNQQNMTKGIFNQVDINISCTGNNCGLINVYLDPVAGYEASGAGSAIVNQIYTYNGDYNGHPKYTGVTESGLDIYFSVDVGTWTLGNVGGEFFSSYYYDSSFIDTPEPPLTGWDAFNGDFPAPTLAESAGGGGKGGLVNTTAGAIPFYTNGTNPINITLNSGESQVVTWWVNATGNLSSVDGLNYTYFAYANLTGSNEFIGDVGNVWNVSIVSGFTPDTTPPNVTDLIFQPSSPTTYSFGQIIRVNATVLDDVEVDEVIFSFNYTNYTSSSAGSIYNITSGVAGLSAGSYSVYVYANDTSGNVNQTTNGTFTIAKANASDGMSLTATSPITYGTTTDALESETNNGDGDCSYSLSPSNGIFGVGVVSFNYSTAGCTNYTAGSRTFDVTINQAVGEVFTYVNNSRSNLTIYQYDIILLNGTLNTGQFGSLNLTIDSTQLNYSTSENLSYSYNFTSLGNFQIKTNYSGNQNYTNDYEIWNVTVLQRPDINNPSVTDLIEQPSSPTTYSPSLIINLNATVTDDIELDLVLLSFNGVNYSTTNLVGDIYNATISGLSAGVYNYYWFANDTSGNVNQTSTGTYTISQAQRTGNLYLNGTQGNISMIYPSQVNASAVSSEAIAINLTRNGVDINSLNHLYQNIPAGEYVYFANFSGNTNYTELIINWNASISKANAVGSLAITPSNTETYGTETSAEGTESNVGDGDIVYTLYKDDVAVSNPDTGIFAVGSYVYLYNSTAGQNYTANANLDSDTLTINKAPMDLTLLLNGTNGNLDLVYPSQVNASTLSTNGTINLTRDGININNLNHLFQDLSVGYYNFTATVLETQNYTGAVVTHFANITKATGNVALVINGTAGNQTAVFGTATNVSASTTQGTIQLLRNGIDVTGENNIFTTLGGGNWNYTAISSGNENYSSATLERWVHISPASSNVALFLGGVQGDNVVQIPDMILLEGNLTIGTFGSLNLTINGEQVNYSSTMNLTYDDVAIAPPRTDIITLNYTGNQNYSASGEQWSLTITAAPHPPAISNLIANPTSPVTYSFGAEYRFNATITDDGGDIDKVVFSFNGTNYTGAFNSSDSIWNITLTGIGAGYYPYFWWVNDSSNLINQSQTLYYNITKATPIGSISGNGTFSYPKETIVQGSESNAGDGDLTYRLYRDGVIVSNPDVQTLAVDTYTYLYNVTSGQNYSAVSSLDSRALTITQNNTYALSITILPSTSVLNGTNTNATGYGCLTGLTCILHRNGVAVDISDNQTLSPATYTYVFNTTGNANYSYMSFSKNLIVRLPTPSGGNVTQCLYKKFSHYNEARPWFRQVGCT